jgi:peptide/nickel transport system substrate-binding protein
MDVFNSFYYSFSPSVASVVASSPALKGFVRALIYPLISILGASSILFNALARAPEIGMIIAGIFASAMLGVVYITPSVIVIGYLIKKKSMLRARIATVLSKSRT